MKELPKVPLYNTNDALVAGERLKLPGKKCQDSAKIFAQPARTITITLCRKLANCLALFSKNHTPRQYYLNIAS